MGILVNQPAPDFEATAVVNGQFKNIKLSDFRDNEYVMLLFYPLDFTFVCPTELHAFQERYQEFKDRGCEVLGVSIDSEFSHFAWLNTPRNRGGIEGVDFPLVSDVTKNIAKNYDVLLDEAGVALRGLFLIDKNGVVQHQVVNNLPLGRSVEEALRVLDALQFFEENGEVCPANWTKGERAMKPNSEGLVEYFSA